MTDRAAASVRLRRFGQTAGMIVSLMGCVAVSAYADKHKLARELRGATSSNSVDVIVQYSALPGVLQKALARGHSGQIGKDLPLVNGLQVSLPANQAAALSNDPGVLYVSPDRKLQGTLNNSAPAVNAPYAWAQGYDARGIGVAVIDSGIGDKQTRRDSRNPISTNTAPAPRALRTLNRGSTMVTGRWTFTDTEHT